MSTVRGFIARLPYSNTKGAMIDGTITTSIGNVLFPYKSFHASGLKMKDFKVGDEIEVEIISYVIRVFK